MKQSVIRHHLCCAVLLLISLMPASSLDARIIVLDNGTSAAKAVSAALNARGTPNSIQTVESAAPAGGGASSADLWIAAHFAQCRRDDLARIIAHIKSGGALLLLGELPFQQLLYPWKNGWISESDYLRNTLAPAPVLRMSDTSPAHYRVATDNANDASTVTIEKDNQEKGYVAHARIPRLAGWCTFNTTVPAEKPAKALTTFWAKGTSETFMLAVEWAEKDHSRWIAKINLTPDWKFYALAPEQFRYWHDANIRDRGGKDDVLRTKNASHFSFGLAQTHTPLDKGPHNFWISDIGMAVSKDKNAATAAVLPEIDGLCPENTAYPVWPSRVELAEAFRQPTAGGALDNLPLPAQSWSTYWRPMGSGYEKKRRIRFVPVVTAFNREGSRAGTLAAITLRNSGEYKNALYGYVSVEDDSILLSPPWLDLIAEMANRMHRRSFFREAGSTKFTYDVRDLTDGCFAAGATTLAMPADNKTSSSKIGMRLNVSAQGRPIFSRDAVIPQRNKHTASGRIKFDGKPGDTWLFRAELLADGKLLDVITHEIGFDGPRNNPDYMTARDNIFIRGGKPWRAFGVNYMPSSGLASTNPDEFEYWLEDPAYDPGIIEADLSRIQKLGMNMISAFIYERSIPNGNLPDLLRRARAHGLLVNLSLRPNPSPLPATRGTVQSIIRHFRLAEKDEIMAYDIAWEPWWGNVSTRKTFGKNWLEWITRKYGSLKAAARAWNFTPPSIMEFPDDELLRREGPSHDAVADYRLFVDDMLTSAYLTTRDAIHAADPNHLVSFRQSEGANPFADPGLYPMDLRSVCKAVDFFSPEGYGIGGDPARTAAMLFAASYAQGLAPGKPVIWAEYGASVWSGSAFAARQSMYDHQAKVFRTILQDADRSRAAGTVAWWFPGGYRRGEESDYGILNPDGTPRSSTSVLIGHAAQAKAPPRPVKWTPEIKVRREDSVRGFAGIYERVHKQFDSAVTSDTIPLIISEH
ncbi:MAG: hypothetical protein WCK47_03985 [bacterium]|nr:hypothetical protein [Candidatus Sumerlaeota bacterium]